MESRHSGAVHDGKVLGGNLDIDGGDVVDLSVQVVGQDRETPSPEVVETTLRAARSLLAIVVKSLAPVLEEVTPGQLRALVILGSQGAQRAGVLAAQLGVHPSTFTRTVDRLAAGGWVSRTENPDSRREVLVELTPKGRNAVALVGQGRREEIVAVLSALSAADQKKVAEGFAAFAQITGEPSISDLAILGG